jgi:hypothetical protein
MSRLGRSEFPHLKSLYSPTKRIYNIIALLDQDGDKRPDWLLEAAMDQSPKLYYSTGRSGARRFVPLRKWGVPVAKIDVPPATIEPLR